MEQEEDFEDIIHLPHYIPQHHALIPKAERAALFSPFAAVIGVDDAASDAALIHIAAVNIIIDDEDWEV